VLYDLLDRAQGAPDLRAATVARLATRFGADAKQARRVGDVAGALLQQSGGGSGDDTARQLAWAAALHEIGTLVSHSDSHKHGAYILENADAPGFAQSELHRLGLLVLGHRGKLRKLEADFDDPDFALQLLALRLAVILCHARRDPDLAGLQLRRTGRNVVVTLASEWERKFPQSAHLLREETVAWQKTPWTLTVVSSNSKG